MIKILFFIETLSGGGAEKVLCNLVNNMNQSEFDITVQTLYPDEGASQLVSGIRYRYCYQSNSKANVFRMRLESELSLTYQLHIKDDYDIECAFLECGATKIIASSTNKKAKKIAWVHCDFSVAFDKTFVEKTKNYYNKYDKIVCVSEKCKESFCKMFGWSDNVDVLYNVIDDREIIRKSLLPLPEGVEKTKLTLCTVGRLTPQKNYPRLLKTCARLRDEGFDFDLWILGDGLQRALIEQIIDELKLQERVSLFGFQSNPYPFIRTSDLLVCSSNYEGLSTFITEALILGKPIVTTDCSGMRELLGESEYGLITENDDNDFYHGLLSIFENTSRIDYYADLSLIRGKQFCMKNQIRNNEVYFRNLK